MLLCFGRHPPSLPFALHTCVHCILDDGELSHKEFVEVMKQRGSRGLAKVPMNIMHSFSAYISTLEYVAVEHLAFCVQFGIFQLLCSGRKHCFVSFALLKDTALSPCLPCAFRAKILALSSCSMP